VFTALTMRLPSTGPTVQKPIAAARPTWGEKSRISAGVVTRTMPSTKATAQDATANCSGVFTFGSTNSVINETTSMPYTIRFARPNRSASPASSEPKAPSRLPAARMKTKIPKGMRNSVSIRVATPPPTYN